MLIFDSCTVHAYNKVGLHDALNANYPGRELVHKQQIHILQQQRRKLFLYGMNKTISFISCKKKSIQTDNQNHVQSTFA